MAAERELHAKEDRRPRAGESVDYPYLNLVILQLTDGLSKL